MLVVNKRATGQPKPTPSLQKCRLLGNIPRLPNAAIVPSVPNGLDLTAKPPIRHIMSLINPEVIMAWPCCSQLQVGIPLHSSAECWKPILGLASARLGTLGNYQPFDSAMLLCSLRMHGAIQDYLSVPRVHLCKARS